MTKSPPIDAFCPVVRQDRDDRGEAPGQEMHAAAGVRARRPFTIGQELRARGACWRVQQIQPYPACRVVLLAPLRNNAHPPIALIAPFDRLTAVSRVERWRGCGLQCLVARLAAAVRDTVTGGAGNLIKPDLSLVPWQWAAATALLRGEASVLLLADVVGLGKTIQAALAIAALRARGDAGRVLILAPAGLREQWQSELERLFRFRCSIVDAPWLRSARREMPPSVNPWTVVSTAIASVDFVKQPEVLAAAAGAPWDVLVVDEAHALGARTDRRVAAAALASCARHVLLLTATPHAGSHDEFAALCRVGTLPGDPAQTLGIRRTRPDVGVDGARRVWVARLVLTGAERRMHALLRSYASAVWHARGRRSPTARLAMTVLLKRGASSAWALHCSVRERLRLLNDEEELPGQPPLPFDDPGETDDSDSTMPSVLREPGLDERERELQILAELRETAYAAAAGESKLARVATLLRRTRESAIVFTEYVDTLDAATRALSAFGPIAMLHGGLSRLDRREAEHAFTAGRARVLLATDVASEGLNLHGCCRLVINLELPWNPVRLEQRIGRVDRIGQARRVHAVLVVGEDTAESYVLERLATRVRNIRRSLGDAYGGTPVSDTLLAGGALGEETTHDPPVSAEAAAFRPWSPAEREAHDICALLDWARRTAAGADPGSDGRTRGERLPMAAVRPRVRARLGLAQGVLLGFRVEATSGNARTAAAAVVMVHVALAAPALSAARPATLVSGVLPMAQAAAARAGAVSMAVEIDAHHRYVARASTREAALLSAATPVDADVPSPLVQPGLFDRRALHEAARQEAAREHRRGLHAARLTQLALEQGLEPEVRAEPILAMVLQ